jgi:O-antigen/teichoic acid export membrane protein
MKILISHSLARNALWIFWGRAFSLVCQAAYFILLARLLGSVEYGIYAGVFSMVSIVSIYSPLGSQYTLLRYVSPDHHKFSLYWGNVLVTIMTLGSLIVVLLVWVVPHLAHSYSWSMVLYVAFGDCICGQIAEAASRVFQAFEEMRFTAFVSLIVNLLRTILAGFLLWHMHHVTAQQWTIAALIISSIAACTALIMVTHYCGRPDFSRGLFCQRVGEGLVFAVSASTTGIYDNFDKAMLGHYGMNAVNGIYTMAYRVIDVGCMPFSAIQSAAFPRFFQKGVGGIQNTASFALRIIKRTGMIALLSTVAMWAAAPIIPYLIGKGFSESVTALRWLCLLPILRSFQYSAGDALTGAGYQKLRLGTQAGAAAFNFAVNLYLIPQYGWLGAAWSSLATDGMLAALNWTVLLAIRSNAKNRGAQRL